MRKLQVIFLALFVTAFVSAQRVLPPQPDSPCCSKQIEVSGEGRASGLADMAVINLSFDQRGDTSAQAVQALSKKVNQAVAILKKSGLGSDAYETGSLNVYPITNYENGKSEVIGQRASQSITVRVRNIDPKGAKVGSLVDALAQVNGIKIDSVSFDIYDKTKLQTLARAEAFKDAKQKAEQFAKVAGVPIKRIIRISDFETVQAPPLERNIAKATFAGAADLQSTSVPIGQLDVNYRTVVAFEI